MMETKTGSPVGLRHFDRPVALPRADALVSAAPSVVNGLCAAHDHAFMEMAFIAGGHGTHRSLVGLRRLVRGDVIALRPGAWHEYNDCLNLQVYNCCFAPELMEEQLLWLLRDPSLSAVFWPTPGHAGVRLVHLPPGPLARCLAHLEALRSLADDRGSGSSMEQIGALLLVLGAMRRHMPPAAPGDSAVKPMHVCVLKAVRLMEKRLPHRWTLGELAAEVRLDKAYLVRLFGRVVGTSPMAYLARRRLERAAALLLSTPLAIKEIGPRVGYDDQNLFARRFRAMHGSSPSAYRAAGG